MKFFRISILVLAIISVLLCATTYASIGGYISQTDKNKFIQILGRTLKVDGDDIVSPYYGARGYQILTVPVEKQQVAENCAHLKKNFKYQSLESSFYVYNTWKILGCQGSLHTPEDVKTIESTLEAGKSTITDIRYALEILTLLKQQIPGAAKVAQMIQLKLKEDDSLQNLGQALHAASLLGANGKFANDRVEDIIVQADEVDGKLLQWEGGLTTTSLILTGLHRLLGKSPLNAVQADKFTNYLLTRKTVQTPKGVLALLEAALAIASSEISPVSISIIGTPQISLEKPDLKIQVSNLLGVPHKIPPTPVVAESITKLSDNSVVLSKQTLKAGSSSTEYILPLKLDPGLYKIVINAGSHSSDFVIRALGQLTVKSLEVGISDSDGGAALKLTKLTYKNKLGQLLQADAGQNLIVKFTLSRPVHQAFLRLHSGKKEIIFVAEQDSSKAYMIEVNLEKELGRSGKFEMELILGDSLITNPIRWDLGSIEVNLGSAAKDEVKQGRGPKPDIQHLFRPAEKRPPEVVSMFFTALTAAPFLLLLILWGKIGINFGNFTPLAIPFHLGFGSILGLFTLFWLKLDMFVTCAWLVPIGGFTFFSGHKILSYMARNRKQEKSDK
ncbi:dolichyl-diphosphooligosaccharide--protein glycosyltransferase subunit 2 [Diorhabda sublineata]|uniref:dolichyl-diphosphooligosaccharide--protein glycosyltransferase subunit 2 n=1 Tax=Diorhabda sublineata TaxID=1163346 RepID=UPI0024E1776E|nr:dolichyl-diphosphooligosaccharide--protein glycosyltransferase subunit 2 [Diorhabda sublineata]